MQGRKEVGESAPRPPPYVITGRIVCEDVEEVVRLHFQFGPLPGGFDLGLIQAPDVDVAALAADVALKERLGFL